MAINTFLERVLTAIDQFLYSPHSFINVQRIYCRSHYALNDELSHDYCKTRVVFRKSIQLKYLKRKTADRFCCRDLPSNK